MEPGLRRPREPKHAHDKQHNANDNGRQARLRNRLVVVLHHGLCVERLVGEVDKHGEQDTDEHAQIRKRGDDGAEVAAFQVYDGDDLEEHVDEGEDKGCVDCHACHGGLCQEHAAIPG